MLTKLNKIERAVPFVTLGALGAAIGVGEPAVLELAAEALMAIGTAAIFAATSFAGKIRDKAPALAWIVSSIIDAVAFNWGRARNKEVN
jgi:hypothetical protein